MTTSFEEFVDKIKSAGVYISKVGEKRDYSYNKIINPARDGFSINWCTGGQSGGSCWDDEESRHYAVGGEPEPEFNDLDQALEAVCPNITFMQYKKLTRDIVHLDDYQDDDYYGNYSLYARKTVFLDELYEKMIDKNLL